MSRFQDSIHCKSAQSSLRLQQYPLGALVLSVSWNKCEIVALLSV